MLQSARIAYRGQVVAVVVADVTGGRAGRCRPGAGPRGRHAADTVLRIDHPALYQPVKVNPATRPTPRWATSTPGCAAAAVPSTRRTRRRPSTTTRWSRTPRSRSGSGDGLTRLRLDAGRRRGAARRSPSCSACRRARCASSPTTSAAGSASRARRARTWSWRRWRRGRVGRPVKLALTRQQMFALAGYRTPTIQRVRLGADARRPARPRSRTTWSSRPRPSDEFAEQTAVATRIMYARAEPPHDAPAGRARRADAVVDARAGRVPGDVRARVGDRRARGRRGHRPGRAAHPQRAARSTRRAGIPFSQPQPGRVPAGGRRSGSAGPSATRARRCAATGAGWSAPASPPRPTRRAAGRRRRPRARERRRQLRRCAIAAADIGTGARTVADARSPPTRSACRPTRVRVELGDSALPPGAVAGGSMGTASWGSAVTQGVRGAARAARREHGGASRRRRRASRPTRRSDVARPRGLARHAFGAQFAEVRVRRRHRRGAGAAAAGRVRRRAHHQPDDGPLAAPRRHDDGRSSMALHGGDRARPRVRRLREPRPRRRTTSPPTPTSATSTCRWIDEDDPHLNPMGTKGIGEIGIVGTAAAIANAVYHATGIRVRDLPIGAGADGHHHGSPAACGEAVIMRISQ